MAKNKLALNIVRSLGVGVVLITADVIASEKPFFDTIFSRQGLKKLAAITTGTFVISQYIEPLAEDLVV